MYPSLSVCGQYIPFFYLWSILNNQFGPEVTGIEFGLVSHHELGLGIAGSIKGVQLSDAYREAQPLRDLPFRWWL